jgi:hypothetical protein
LVTNACIYYKHMEFFWSFNIFIKKLKINSH